MNLQVGMIVLTALSMLLTWFIFGRKVNNGKKGAFIYWLKSMAITSGVLLGWLLYNDPSIGFGAALIISVLISVVVNLSRSQWVFLFP